MLNAALMLQLANADFSEDHIFAQIHAAAINGDIGVYFEADVLSETMIKTLRKAGYAITPDTGCNGPLFVSWG